MSAQREVLLIWVSMCRDTMANTILMCVLGEAMGVRTNDPAYIAVIKQKSDLSMRFLDLLKGAEDLSTPDLAAVVAKVRDEIANSLLTTVRKEQLN